MGLEWIQQNIKHFGGNPHNVTLFRRECWFVRRQPPSAVPAQPQQVPPAIMQSGTANMPWGTLSQDEAKRRALELPPTTSAVLRTTTRTRLSSSFVRVTPPPGQRAMGVAGYHAVSLSPSHRRSLPSRDALHVSEAALLQKVPRPHGQ